MEIGESQNQQLSDEVHTRGPQVFMDRTGHLEVSEIDFRSMCDLVRYRMFRDAGIVKTVDDFLKLLHPSDEKEGSG